MRRLYNILLVVFCFIVSGCDDDDNNQSAPKRSFKMGFTTWSYGPNLEDVNNTYSFIADNADIYTEHIDNKIPWNAWMNGLPLPTEFTNEIRGRVDKKISQNQLLLSVSLLNGNRDDLAEDFDGTVPSYTALNDQKIEDAYVKHVDYLVSQLQPNYLVVSIEANELRLRAESKWDAYKLLMQNVRARVKQLHPSIGISESISLHNLYQPDVAAPQDYIDDMVRYMNLMDFVAISYYPFLKNHRSKVDFQQTFDFLHESTSKPIAVVESSHLAEDLTIPNLNVSISGNENE